MERLWLFLLVILIIILTFGLNFVSWFSFLPQFNITVTKLLDGLVFIDL